MKEKGTADERRSPFVGPDDENQNRSGAVVFSARFKCEKRGERWWWWGGGGLVTLAGA